MGHYWPPEGWRAQTPCLCNLPTVENLLDYLEALTIRSVLQTKEALTSCLRCGQASCSWKCRLHRGPLLHQNCPWTKGQLSQKLSMLSVWLRQGGIWHCCKMVCGMRQSDQELTSAFSRRNQVSDQDFVGFDFAGEHTPLILTLKPKVTIALWRFTQVRLTLVAQSIAFASNARPRDGLSHEPPYSNPLLNNVNRTCLTSNLNKRRWL